MATKSWKVSVITRLIVSFVLILLPIYLLGFYIYNNGLTILRKEISNSMVSQVSFYLDNLENEIDRVQLLQYELINDRDINRMSTISKVLTNIQQVEGILRIQNRLVALKNSSEYIRSSQVLIPDADKEVVDNDVTEFSKERFNVIKAASEQATTNIVYLDNSMFLVTPYPTSHITSREPIFIINTQLSKEVFEKALRSMTNSKDEGVVLYNTSNGYMVATNYDNDFHEKVKQQIFSDSPAISENAKIITVDGTRYLLAYKTSDFFESVLYKYVPEDAVFKTLEKYRVWFFIFTALAILVIMIYSIYVKKFIHKPINRLVLSFEQVKRGNLDINIEHEIDDEFRFIYRNFNSMVKELKTLIDQSYKQKILVQRAEMKQLQSQINPHFLYNSFFILNTMARTEDYENIEKFTEQLGRYFQFITRSAADEVPLEKEVEHARVYTEIQAMRYSNRIKAYFEELPEEFWGIVVPRLILQPIIENAFEHGLGMVKKNGILTVSFEKLQNGLHIIIENNGEIIEDKEMEFLRNKLTLNDKKEEVTAISNIHQRLQLKFGHEYGLIIERGDKGGLKVIISIPYEKTMV
ncbi:MAG: histidine kinase [Clostridiaceae bacterium]|nr:histidine kinase [Clostridiaceae bacterium]